MHTVAFIILGLLSPVLSSYAATPAEVQGMLQELGYAIGTADGRWGAKSRNALKQFQSSQALPATGKIDAKTVSALQKHLKTKTTNTPTAAESAAAIINPPPDASSATQPSSVIVPTTDLSASIPHQQGADKQQSIVTPAKVAAPQKTSIVPTLPVQVQPTLVGDDHAITAKSPAPTPAKATINPNKPIKTTTGPKAKLSAAAILEQPPITSPAGIKFVHIPGGCFTMGGGAEQPHEVCVHDNSSFFMGQYEVTQRQWQAITGINPATHDNSPNHPVENVSWNDVDNFIAKLNAQGQGKYRLPTEAEWEYSARAGRNTIYWWGDTPPVCTAASQSNGANFAGDSKCPGGTVAVGTYKPNPFGLYDVHGNVWEWVADIYLADAYKHHQRQNPTITTGGGERVFRGGSWLYPAEAMAVFHRDHAPEAFKFSHLGLRLIFEP